MLQASIKYILRYKVMDKMYNKQNNPIILDMSLTPPPLNPSGFNQIY